MRSQPFWQQIRGQGDFTDAQRRQLEAALAQQGISIPSDFRIDEGGNFQYYPFDTGIVIDSLSSKGARRR